MKVGRGWPAFAAMRLGRVRPILKAGAARWIDDLTGDAETDTAIIGGSAIALRAWAYDLLAIVRGCAG